MKRHLISHQPEEFNVSWKASAVLCLLFPACATVPAIAPDPAAESWAAETKADDLKLAPGDRIEIVVHSAQELNRTVQIAPDGQVRLPLIGPQQAACETPESLAEKLQDAYASQLREPSLDVIPVGFGGQKVFVGGAVVKPGTVDLSGPLDPMQALILAGGPNREARIDQVMLMRRMPDGSITSILIDLKNGLRNPGEAMWFPLQRYDVIYVPRTPIANQNRFMSQYVRKALPLDFFVVYDLAD